MAFLVQAQDKGGFWCNVAELDDPAFANKYAQHWAQEHKQATRVVSGGKRRAVASEFSSLEQSSREASRVLRRYEPFDPKRAAANDD